MPFMIKWSGSTHPFGVGAQVKVILNGWDSAHGIVEGYEVCGEWLMCRVRVKNRPTWHRNESPTRDVPLFAGCELAELEGVY